MGRTFTLHSIAHATAYRRRIASPGKCPPCLRVSAIGLVEPSVSTAKPTYGLTSDWQASRQVRSTLRLFARRIDLLLFLVVHFFDGRILVALAGCQSSCRLRAGGWRRWFGPVGVSP